MWERAGDRTLLKYFDPKVMAVSVVSFSFFMAAQPDPYRTLHSYKSFWAVCHLFPQRWRTLTYSVSGNHCPGGPRDMLTTTSACVNSSPASLSHLQDGIFYKYVVFKHPLPLWPNFSTAATPWMGLVDIHIQGLWDAFPSLRNCLFQTIEKGHFKLAILFVA